MCLCVYPNRAVKLFRRELSHDSNQHHHMPHSNNDVCMMHGAWCMLSSNVVPPIERNVISLSASRVSNTDNEKRNAVNTVQFSGIFAV